MNKEEYYNFDIPIMAWISRFFSHIFLKPKHNSVKEGKKDQLIFNVAECPTMDASSISISLMTLTKQGTKMDCALGQYLPGYLPTS